MAEIKDAPITVWDRDGRITLYIGGDALHSVVSMSPERAERLICDIRKAIDRMPRVACEADLGIAA